VRFLPCVSTLTLGKWVVAECPRFDTRQKIKHSANLGFPVVVDGPMPWLTFEAGAMPKLTYLQLKFCSTLATLQDFDPITT
jgi:hypothetical protein